MEQEIQQVVATWFPKELTWIVLDYAAEFWNQCSLEHTPVPGAWRNPFVRHVACSSGGLVAFYSDFYCFVGGPTTEFVCVTAARCAKIRGVALYGSELAITDGVEVFLFRREQPEDGLDPGAPAKYRPLASLEKGAPLTTIYIGLTVTDLAYTKQHLLALRKSDIGLAWVWVYSHLGEKLTYWCVSCEPDLELPLTLFLSNQPDEVWIQERTAKATHLRVYSEHGGLLRQFSLPATLELVGFCWPNQMIARIQDKDQLVAVWQQPESAEPLLWPIALPSEIQGPSRWCATAAMDKLLAVVDDFGEAQMITLTDTALRRTAALPPKLGGTRDQTSLHAD